MSEIKAFAHCGCCLRQGRRDRLEVGLIDPVTLGIRCQLCNQPVAEFTLAQPIALRCDVCGEPLLGPEHTH